MNKADTLRTKANLHTFPCPKCGANLTFTPGTTQMGCTHCGHVSEIHEKVSPIIEYDFHSTLNQLKEAAPSQETQSISCQSCAAEFEFDSHIHAAECPFCGTPVISDTHKSHQIQPHALLPFNIDHKQAEKAFQTWLKKLWFAPNQLKVMARKDRPMNGIYVPYWTYDSKTITQYRGQRGTVYYVQKRVRVKINGRWQTQIKSVPQIRWTAVSGQVRHNFDDVLIYASKSLPRNMAHELEPWDLHKLTPYQTEYLSGFQSEMYQTSLDEGFTIAKERMHPLIRQDICRDIGGDQQRITQMQTQYNDIHFKHILMPFWVAGFRYRKKQYQFIVNGRTGEVQGKRPYSWIKILFAIILGSILAAVFGYVAIESGILENALQNNYY